MSHPDFYGFYKCEEIRQRSDGKFGVYYRKLGYCCPGWWWFDTLKDVENEIDVGESR
ncbi:hypothetical protein LCGC14_0479600 [marine sediment metagenome]|uniref:Uncharacterized protein n=1 Tax=marine sediment metagenome TaxID=412755 RepID=A0A0F9SF31_9ZZZZ